MCGGRGLSLAQMLRDVNKDPSLLSLLFPIFACAVFVISLWLHGGRMAAAAPNTIVQHSGLEKGSRVRQKKYFLKPLPPPADFLSDLNG